MRSNHSTNSIKPKPVTAATLGDALRAACTEVGIVERDVPIDGRWHKTDINGDPRGRGDGRIKVFVDGEGGIACNWKYEQRPFFVDDGHRLSKDERLDRERRRVEAIRLAKEEQDREHTEAAVKAARCWNTATPAPADYPYLIKKSIKPHGLRVRHGALLVPVYIDNQLRSLQFITVDNKKFLSGGAVSGGCFFIGEPSASVLCIAEGFATAASIYEATGYPVAVAFDSGNLGPVAQALRARFPDSQLVLCADDDANTTGNPGLTKATEAALAVGGTLAVPNFGENRPEGATDFNDLVVACGAEAAREAIAGAEAPAEVEKDEDAFRRLAALSPVEYDRVREDEAKRLGVRVPTLDAEVEKRRKMGDSDDAQGKAVQFPDIEPWPEPVDGALLLSDLSVLFKSYAVLPKHAAAALSLWVVFTHAIDYVDVAPILGLTSPVRRCGKSTLIALLKRLVLRALSSSNISSAALFRSIECWTPTLLIDEADSFLRNSDELRGIINSGHTRDSAYVLRTCGDDHEPRQFSTWAAKAIALIGKLPETIEDRTIEIPLKRKLKSERVKKLRHADPAMFTDLARRCARWVSDYADQIRASRPSVPDTLNDREQDSWDPLIAIADLAGGEWPKLAREAASAMSGGDEDTGGLGVELLGDIRVVFEDRSVDRISSEDLVLALVGLEERRWAEYSRGKPLTMAKLARLLRPYGVVSGTIRLLDRTAKGYLLEQFADAFSRYLPPDTPSSREDPPFKASQRHNVGGARDPEDFENVTAGGVLRFENGPEPSCGAGCDGVTDSTPPPGGVRGDRETGTI